LVEFKELVGHTSPETAYVVDDYPYGFKARTRIRYWIDAGGKKGWRMISQTEDPKTKRWNKPKASTYAAFGGAMYLDSDNHVAWAGVGEYSTTQAILDFVKTHSHADMSMLKRWVTAKAKYIDDMMTGKRVWHVNGVPKPPTDHEIGEYRHELAQVKEIGKHIGVHV
jgi:hypothetical protein